MTESEFTNKLTAALAKHGLLSRDGSPGWWVSHDPESRGQAVGEEDLQVRWRGPGACPGPHPAFFAELKQGAGRRTDEQRRHANAGIVAGLQVYEWKVPADTDMAEWAFGLPPGSIDVGDEAGRLCVTTAPAPQGAPGVGNPASAASRGAQRYANIAELMEHTGWSRHVAEKMVADGKVHVQ